MTTNDDFDDAQWQAQERARRQAAIGQRAAPGDADAARDLLVAQALRSMPMPGLPADFAAGVARQVGAGVAASPSRAGVATEQAGLEQVLTAVLGLTLGFAAAGAAWVYGADWWQASAPSFRSLGQSALHWIGAGAACAGMSWLATRWRPVVRRR